MELIMFLCLVGLAVMVGRLHQEVQRLKVRDFLRQMTDQEAATIAHLRTQRLKGEARLRDAAERRWPQ